MTLRQTALRSGVDLVAREVVGLVIRFAGAILLVRLISPSEFGMYAGALAVVTVLTMAAQLGSDVYLIRRRDEPSARMYDQVFTILLASTAIVVVLSFLGSLAFASLVEFDAALAPFQVMLLIVPLNALWAPAQAKLERGFHFRRMAALQVGSDAVLYAVAIVFAVAGLGVWAPVLGTIASAILLLLGSYALSGFLPRIDLSRERFLELGKFALEFTPSPLLWFSLNLVNPLVVGTFVGSAGVGYVALATRLADTVSFVVRAAYRIALVTLTRLQDDGERLRRGFEEMMTIQAVGVGVPLAALSAVSPWFVPFVFGDEWSPALDVLPFVSIGYLAFGVFNMHVALLYVLGRVRETSIIAFVRFALLSVAALVLVPALDIVGYGLAVLVSAAGWVLADLVSRREFRSRYGLTFRYGLTVRWMLALLPAMFIPFFDSPWALLLVTPVVPLLVYDRGSRARIREYVATLRTPSGQL